MTSCISITFVYVFHDMFYYSLVAENFTLTTVWKTDCTESLRKMGEQEGEEKRSDGGLGQNGSAGGDETPGLLMNGI